MSEEAENIKVAVRCRPMSEKEIREQAQSCFLCDDGEAILVNPQNKDDVQRFGYDFVYGCDTKQELVYNEIGQPILDRAFGGYNGTIFAYGQTGSGKTFSMTGVNGSIELEGLIPRMNKAIFDRIEEEKRKNPNILFLVECSFFEIYNEIIYDLLRSSSTSKKGKGLEIKEHSVLGIYVKDLQERVVETRDEVIELMTQGQQSRTVGATQMNSESSRSHSIFVIKIHQKDSTDESKNVFAKINLVDLAGSERAGSTGAEGSRLKEGANINKSLSALGNVINALVEVARTKKKQFIPYRNSKLTRVLQESLGGNSLCSMLATLSPANINFTETLGTLKYASRAKSIKVNAKKNEESSKVSQLNEEISLLKKKLQEQTAVGSELDPKEKEDLVAKYEKQIQDMDRIRMQTWEDKAKLSKRHEMERKKLAKEKAMADKKIQEEKKKRWKMLEEKGDIEFAIRAIRDLECGNDEWSKMAASTKLFEQEAKEQRTLIMVFKDSFDDDVKRWKLGDSEENSSQHVIMNQICSKLKNINEEGKKMRIIELKLLKLINSLLGEIQAEIDGILNENLLSQSPEDNMDKSIIKKKESVNALKITLKIIKTYRKNVVENIKIERNRLFEFSDASNELLKGLDRVLDSGITDGGDEEPLLAVKAEVNNAVAGFKSLRCKVDTPKKELKPSGDSFSLGMEKRLILDSQITASSNGELSKYARLNGPKTWFPEPDDSKMYLEVDLKGNIKSFKEVHLQGGYINIHENEDIIFSKSSISRSLSMYHVESVSGDCYQTYDIVSCIISWKKLLKTSQIPLKLLSRPPVRFLHDLFSLIIESSQYAIDLFTEKEKDYTQLVEKEDRLEYLTKLVNFTKQSFESDDIDIKVKPANIVSGKDASETLKFVSYFTIASLRHLEKSNTEPNLNADNEQVGWVSEFSVMTCVDGNLWKTFGPFCGCNDENTTTKISLCPDIMGNKVRFVPLKSHNFSAVRMDFVCCNVIEEDHESDFIENDDRIYDLLLESILTLSSIMHDKLKQRWEKNKESQLAKQVELESLIQQNAGLQKKFDSLKSELSNLESKYGKLEDEKIKSEFQLKQELVLNEAISKKILEAEEINRKLTNELGTTEANSAELQDKFSALNQQKKELEDLVDSLKRSKLDLENLNLELRNQLSSNSSIEGSKQQNIIDLENELTSANIKLEEYKRNELAMEKSKADVLASNESLKLKLSDIRADLAKKENEIQSLKAIEEGYEAKLKDIKIQYEIEHNTAQTLSRREKELEVCLETEVAKNCEREEEYDKILKRNAELSLQVAENEKLAGKSENDEILTTQNLRLQAENDRLEGKCSNFETKVGDLENKIGSLNSTIIQMEEKKNEFDEQEEDLLNQIQVLTEERDTARQKEEQLFVENNEKDEEIERIRDGYVWVTDRMNTKEDELADLQDQLEKYQSLLEITNPSFLSSNKGPPVSIQEVSVLYKDAFGEDHDKSSEESVSKICSSVSGWIKDKKLSTNEKQANFGNNSIPKDKNFDAKLESRPPSITMSVSNPAEQKEEDDEYDEEDFDEEDNNASEILKKTQKSSFTKFTPSEESSPRSANIPTMAAKNDAISEKVISDSIRFHGDVENDSDIYDF